MAVSEMIKFVPGIARVCLVLACSLCVFNNNRFLQFLNESDESVASSDAHRAVNVIRTRPGEDKTAVDQQTPHGRELQSMETIGKRDFPGLVSCQRITTTTTGTNTQGNSNTTTTTRQKYHDPSCPRQFLADAKNNGTKILLYNPFHLPRTVCGHVMDANSITLLVSHGPDNTMTNCLLDSHPVFGLVQQTRVYPVNNPSGATSSQLPPTTILEKLQGDKDSSNNPPQEEPQPVPDCNIPCHATSPKDDKVLRTKTIAGTNWTIVFSMEGPQYYRALRINETAHLEQKFYATTSFQSEIPLPYFTFGDYPLQALEPVHFDKAIKGAVWLASNCASHNHRELFVKELMNRPAHVRYIRVDSMGQCGPNAKWPKDAKNKQELLRKYLFYLAFENQNENDYITEKLWGALAAGVVPVYLGGDNIQEHVPPHSIINVKDFKTPKELGQYLKKVSKSKELYESYHAWRKQPLPQSFLAKYNFTRTHSTCRICKWAFAKTYGLGWDPAAQQIRNARISRSACFRPSGLLSRPFVESWGQHGDVVDGDEVCNDEQQQNTIVLSGGTVRRTVQSRDGVLDLFLESNSRPNDDTLVMQLDLPSTMAGNTMTNEELLQRRDNHQHWLQDDKSRITILSSRVDVTLEVKRQGPKVSLQVVIPDPSIPLHFRFIIEDINNFYGTGKTEPQHFAKTMIDEWMKPIERFRVL
ncbi:Glycoprotein 3-alpha-L-fucosyltransferase A [Seminavis robusta]|uniref:Fucosyltransferase n=1 Tax=Seminavis robusta TaxID=568900 RepID=A0A9N8ECX9_9STRA|nr:Glycoprotein 3-alpha-L-fucosyltransferase A [Seminavis robusta]|eukprot:Sro966_g225680.1 Glycoprotein 3-alpha-L-fucosyltransferase A (698) ;mRNA; r:11238-13331